ncbi:hypothetical protein THRCLA_21611 [Thraustotheca clavata]|uniref:Uncharacterized protein n=1 Tax=Thraustotheca clavata TaxID=74557 RepID=A0A1V9ZUW5_9STRA|nr:hypothetical protein THRCLA_21611 [Thraustotheca clavata]
MLAKATSPSRRNVFFLLVLILVVGSVILYLKVFYRPSYQRVELLNNRISSVWTKQDFECIEWQATTGCVPHGKPSYTLPCNASITEGMSGYCQIRNISTGHVYQSMFTWCNSINIAAKFTCNDALAFSNYPIQAANYVHKDPVSKFQYPRGIVFSVYERAIPGVVAIIQLLRSYNCTLPVELFYDPSEFNLSTSLAVQKLIQTDENKIVLRTIDDLSYIKFRTKPYALYYSHFQQVLFLDCDNIPLRDPTYLFDLLNASTTAVFWPDYWQPSYTEFNVHQTSLLWEYLDMSFVDGFEQESGQLLVDRNSSRAALNKLMFYTQGPKDASNFLESKLLVYGDKDLFRLAWTNTSTPYHYIEEPPAFAGVYRWWLTRFCGLTMVQFDHHGDMVFLHRNMIKLNGDSTQKPELLHIARFNTSTHNVTEQYKVECKGRQLGGKLCWGFKYPFVPYQVTPIDNFHPIHIAEAKVISFAIKAGEVDHLQKTNPVEIPTNWLWFQCGLSFGILIIFGLLLWRRKWYR